MKIISVTYNSILSKGIEMSKLTINLKEEIE